MSTYMTKHGPTVKGPAFKFFGCQGRICWCPGCGLQNCKDLRTSSSDDAPGCQWKAYVAHHKLIRDRPDKGEVEHQRPTKNLKFLGLQHPTWVPNARMLEAFEAWKAAGEPEADR